MRSSIIIFLVGAILLANIASTSLPRTAPLATVHADTSSSTTTAWTNLVTAYSTVKQAESHGTSHDTIARLAGELDTALNYYKNSTLSASQNNSTGAEYYANLSTSKSNNVTSEANALDTTARSGALQRQEITYFASFIIALVSSTLLIEKDRLERFLQKKRIITERSE